MFWIALCVFAVGMVINLAIAALCIALFHAGDGSQFVVCAAAPALCAVCLVLNLEKIGRQRATAERGAAP